MVWSALKETFQSKLTVAKMWLDIPNEYGFIPLRFIFFGFKHYGVDPHLLDLYNQEVLLRDLQKVLFQTCKSSWHQYCRGIFAECTV